MHGAGARRAWASRRPEGAREEEARAPEGFDDLEAVASYASLAGFALDQVNRAASVMLAQEPARYKLETRGPSRPQEQTPEVRAVRTKGRGRGRTP